MCWAEIRLLTRERLRLLLMLLTGFFRSHLASVLEISSSTRRFLTNTGVRDFAQYQVVPGADLLPDLFLD